MRVFLIQIHHVMKNVMKNYEKCYEKCYVNYYSFLLPSYNISQKFLILQRPLMFVWQRQCGMYMTTDHRGHRCSSIFVPIFYGPTVTTCVWSMLTFTLTVKDWVRRLYSSHTKKLKPLLVFYPFFLFFFLLHDYGWTLQVSRNLNFDKSQWSQCFTDVFLYNSNSFLSSKLYVKNYYIFEKFIILRFELPIIIYGILFSFLYKLM
jgi:hypothetical protein